ncbi:ABC transporter permease [Clostridiaceae bacterium M8S5]|nr:ABC transporter permease [Clostridiaceae bacterium M8S5]
MNRLRVLTKTELILSMREFSGMLFGVLLPAGLMMLLGVLYSGNSIKIGQSFSAVVTIGICATGLMGIPLTVTNYREKKVLKRFQVTPTSPLLLLLAQFLNNFIFAVVSSSIVYIIARFAFDYTMKGSIIQFIIVYLFLLIVIYSIGILIASVSNSIKTANLLCTLAYFPMFLLSGATVPYEIMPRGLQRFSEIMPLTQGIKMLKTISLGNTLKEYDKIIIILIIVSVISLIVSVKFFRYDFE